ncbi:FAD-binding oxidoreductase [Thermoflexus sp.]|uniref:NAD(P)/FAD-dependent oxidoreductase n=1 Tax=Thermoflexus sp. TaxID=1969742 RepID=UPI0025CC8861|nr:FAD-dependent oxidoreductase [Thermoflexus sp.]MDW8179798.1 FAD-dependent oxidoreductase [Anaerolineae bacterium]MCS6964828.1 FAD-binding oxidoreductase [Thermoflexus sp.]MCS7350347.1 FAD-binding oxidoreductase [Thermoflexus sp.]MCX7689808.1 FAD-binding oxidoreductase [Thermoflexus sp.]MDW8183704.1 FAD-dependent oxidoreductase [Anaerolineae bacterium]
MKAVDIVICGAGIAGISAAYHLTLRQPSLHILLIDRGAPLSLTSDKSTEAYRNWWPGPDDAMVRLMNRSIDLMEELARSSGNAFCMNRRGYLYVTADPSRAEQLLRAAEQAAYYGAGLVRRHERSPSDPVYVPSPPDGFEGSPDGVDVFLDPEEIRRRFPYLSERTVAVLHVRRCGWLSAYGLGMKLLEQARSRGTIFRTARLIGVEVQGGRIRAVRLAIPGMEERVETGCLVNAAGPFFSEVNRMLGVDLPVFCELHRKVMFRDEAKVVPRDAPLIIWADPQQLPWSEEERELLEEMERTDLLETLPGGAHLRPEGGVESPYVLMLWPYETRPLEPIFPLPEDPLFPEVVLRGLTAVIPGLAIYWGRMPRPVVDGGYYVKTPENRPLIGPLPVEGAYAIGALSGFGVMAALAAGELLAAHVLGEPLPDYAPAFAPDRYERAEYRARLRDWGETWQL